MVYAMHAVAAQTLLSDPGPADGVKAATLASDLCRRAPHDTCVL